VKFAQLVGTLWSAQPMLHASSRRLRPTVFRFCPWRCLMWWLRCLAPVPPPPPCFLKAAIAILLVVMGFTTYVLVPFSFITGNFALFLSIMSAILVGMLLGLTLISQSLQVGRLPASSFRVAFSSQALAVVCVQHAPCGPVLRCPRPPREVLVAADPLLCVPCPQSSAERLVLWLLVWGKDSPLRGVVQKNLAGHASRNRKTAYMVRWCHGCLLLACMPLPGGHV
jgi:hypothetical protein